MAANNYYVQGNGYVDSLGRPIFKVTESIGDSVFNGNMIDSGTLRVIPNSGYTVSASLFSVTNLTALTTPFSDDGTENSDYRWVENITLVDTGTAGEASNQILITINFVSSGPRGPLTLDGDFLIKLDIDGKALVNNVLPDIDINQEIIIENNTDEPDENVNTISNGDAVVTFALSEDIIMNTVVDGNFSEVTLTGQVAPDVPTEIANVNVVADTNRYFQETPFLSLMSMPSGILALRSPTITRDSNNRITAYNFKLIYRNNVPTVAKSGAKAYVRYKTTIIPTVTKEISKVKFGDSQVSSQGDVREIIVYGDNNAEFDLTITKDSDGSSILDTSLAVKDILTPEYGEIKAISKKLISSGRKAGKTSFKFNQEFPAYSAKILTSALDAASSGDAYVVISGNLNTAGVKVGDRIIMKEVLNSTPVKVTEIVGDVRANLDTAITAPDEASIIFSRLEKYYINIYPRSETTLRSNIPTTKPHYTINQYNPPVLKIKTIENDGAYTGPTNVYTYTGKANALPNQTSSAVRMFSMSWTMTRGSGTFTAVKASGIPAWSSVDATASDWSNSLPTINGGTHIEIFNIKVTGVGTTTYTITADVLIKKWGIEDVTMTLDLDTIIT